MKRIEKKQKNEATPVARFAVCNNLYEAMRGFAHNAIAFGVIAVMCLNIFATCADDEPEIPDAPKEETFAITVGQSGDWTPFRGENGVTFSNSNSSVISVSDNRAKVTFTGLKAGISTITAMLGSKIATAKVTVTDGGSENDKPGEPTDPDPPTPPFEFFEPFPLDVFYSGTLTFEKNLDYMLENGTRITTVETERIDFVYKFSVINSYESFRSYYNWNIEGFGEWVPFMSGSGNQEINGYISASYFYENKQYSDDVSTSTITASVESTEAENNIVMEMYYNKNKNKYRLMITGNISSIICKYVGTIVNKTSHSSETDKFSDDVGSFAFSINYDLNYDNDGKLDTGDCIFLDLDNSDVEEFFKNSKKNELKIKFDAPGTDYIDSKNKREKYLKADIVIGN